MKLFDAKGPPNPRRVRVFLAEKGLTVPTENVDLLAGAHQTPEFLAMNPFGRIPLLMLDDGTCLAESMAICRYFEALHPDPPLFGRGPLGQAVVEMWNRRVEFGLFWHVAQVFRHLHPKLARFEVPQIAAWGEANRPKVHEMLALLDARLQDSRFIAGGDFTVADITALVSIGLMKPARIERSAGHGAIDRWWGEVAARPSFEA